MKATFRRLARTPKQGLSDTRAYSRQIGSTPLNTLVSTGGNQLQKKPLGRAALPFSDDSANRSGDGIRTARRNTCARQSLRISITNESYSGQPLADPFKLARRAILVLLLAIPAAFALAQADPATDNDVIRVAQRMYCPVCENIPLDECQTRACLEWKDEIRNQLAAGASDQDVIDSFVARFGDHVVGVPQDPLLRALTLIMPLLATALAIAVGFHTFRIFGRRQTPGAALETASSGEVSDEAYRQRLEDDVRARL